MKFEETGTEDLDVYLAYYEDEQAATLNELYWKITDPFYEAYWNDSVDKLKGISKGIRKKVGVYYGVAIAMNISAEDELLLLVSDNNVNSEILGSRLY